MSMLRSWFQQQTSHLELSWRPPEDTSRHGLLSGTAERIPSPTSSPHSATRNSSLPRPSRGTSRQSADPLLALERYEADIRRHLQTLLDAQGEGLLAGIGGQDVDSQSVSDTASSTGARSAAVGKAVPIRQPVRKPLSLGAARRGIKRALRELSALKEQESGVYEQELSSDRDIANRIAAWEERRDGLEKEIGSIQNDEGSSRAQELRKEDNALQEQITAMENQLMELRGQQNAVKLELSRLDNSVQSKLSSYTAALKIVDNEVTEFLSRPPLHPQRASHEDSVYFALPAPRRTLGMALAHTQEEKRALEERRRKTQEEKDAIEEGLVVWADTIAAVAGFERDLRNSLQTIGGETSVNMSPRQDAGSSMSGILERMDQVMNDLESKLNLAEARGWKLLICCIGAELEALRQGRNILEQAQSSSDNNPDEQRLQGSKIDQSVHRSMSSDSSPARRSSDSFRKRNERPAVRVYRPEDDEPDPELLISKADTDTE